MKLELNIACNNAAFDDGNLGPELARILGGVARYLGSEDSADIRFWIGEPRSLRDINGNTVGTWAITETPAEEAARLSKAEEA